MNVAARVCLIGGSGFIGSRLACALARRGVEIVVPTRSPARARHLLVLPSAHIVATDVSDPAALAAVLHGCHAAVNLVGILNERGRDGAGFRRVHADLASTITAAGARAGIGKLVQVSALNADPVSGPSHYLRSKGEAERVITEANAFGWSILRPSVVFGPGDSFVGRFARLLRRIPLLFPLAMPQARFAPVHVDDVAQAIVRCLEDPATTRRTYQLCGAETLSLAEIVQRIDRAAGMQHRILGLPAWASRLQARFMDFVPGKPFSTDNYLSLTVDSVCSENGMAALGILPRSFEGGLAEALAGILTPTRLDTLRQAAGRSGA
jgi:NADH dehydrogenase